MKRSPEQISTPWSRDGKSIFRRPSGVRKAKQSVLIADFLADRLITLGGISVLLAVMGIMVFLIGEVIPLFQGARIKDSRQMVLENLTQTVALFNLDEQAAMAFGVTSEGRLFAFHTGTGTLLKTPSWELGDGRPTAWALSQDKENLAIGFEDGSVRLGTLRVVSHPRKTEDVPLDLMVLSDEDRTDGKNIYRLSPSGEARLLVLEASLEEPIKVSDNGGAILKLDYRIGGTEERPTRSLAALDEHMNLWVNRVEIKRNLLTGQTRESVQSKRIKVSLSNPQEFHLLLGGQGSMVLLISEEGELLRFDVGRPQGQELVERARLTPQGVKVSCAAFLSGERSLVVGGSDGSVGIWFLVHREQAPTEDGRSLVLARQLSKQKAPIVGIEGGTRGKTFVTWDAGGELRVRHATSKKNLAVISWPGHSGLRAALAPRLDALVALGSNGIAGLWHLVGPHPETSLETLFGKVWYEGRSEPEFVWQSSGATEDFEPKLSLVPLIFGTLKGTFYALMFAVPLAILGAIYTSEFLSPQVRSKVKPVMEVMASLPSVILGFVAALVLAPVVESWISSVLISFLLIPLGLLLGGYVLQLFPDQATRGIQGLKKLFLIACVIAFGLFVSLKIGSAVEQIFFAGDLKAWLSGGARGALPPLCLVLLPMNVCLCAFFLGKRLWPWNKSRWAETGRAAAVFFTASVMSLLGAWLLEWMGFDPRSGFVGAYVQRNTLVVAFAMGFAVIPLIYTLAEEALSGVPDHLRAASLSCGATPWQTALWVVLPTAASGVFSAIMIGMGRAVGETMIVVMAAGNTPIIDLNLFNGFRALSANIAVELPEAVKGGTLYRVLFLTALVLFSMTFVINTLAELVRQRFRKRAQQL